MPDGPCDTPWALVNATFEYIDKVWKDKIDFIVWTGDNVRFIPLLKGSMLMGYRHDNDHHFPRSPSHIFGYNRVIRDKFYEIFKPNNSFYPLSIPIIPSYGNNDVWPYVPCSTLIDIDIIFSRRDRIIRRDRMLRYGMI